MKSATVALVVYYQGNSPQLLETLSDDREITLFESACEMGEPDPLQVVMEFREKQTREDNDFGDYVEELLSQPFVRPEVQEHAVQWLKSKIRIEQFQKTEVEAANVIAQYAYNIFQAEPEKRDFFLAGPKTQVRIRVFVLSQSAQSMPSAA